MRVLSLLLSVVLAIPRLTHAADKDKDETAPVIYNIPRLDKITIDGDAADWADAGFRIDAFAPADGHVVPPTDFDATCRVAWNDTGLLVLVRVADDDLRESNFDDRRLAEGDSVEVHLSVAGLTTQYVIAPKRADDAEPRTFSAVLRHGQAFRNDVNAVASSRLTPAGYVIEAFIPVDALPAARRAGNEIGIAIVVNDLDATAARRRYAPLWLAPRTDADPLPSIPLCPDTTASPPFAAALSITPLPGQGRARAVVVADSTAAGRSVELRLGPAPLKLDLRRDDKPPLPAIVAERIGRLGDRWGADFTFPLPPVGTDVGPVNVYVDSAKIARVTLPSDDAARSNALSQYDLAFRPAVFAGDQFPPCDFVAPAAVRDLIGPYSFKYTFFDPDRNVVERPGKPGRYGAVVEIVTAAGNRISKRLVTLFHQSDPQDWQDGQLDARIVAMPPQLGIDPKVVAAQQKLLGDHARYLLPDVFAGDIDTPLLLAALFESRPDGPPLAGRNSIWARNEAWWYPIKQRLKRAKYRYTADVPRLYLPERDPPLPVLLCLHGSGERGDDLTAVRTHGPPKLVADREFPFLVVAPQCPAGEWWNAQQLIDLLDEVATNHRIDPDRVYLTGLSMGGYGVWELAAEHPERFAAIVPICGAGGVADAPRLKDLPTWVFHGMKDREVPFNRSVEMVEALKQAGGRVRFTPYPDLGHDCWTTAYDTPALYEWLLKQKRGAPAEPAAPKP